MAVLQFQGSFRLENFRPYMAPRRYTFVIADRQSGTVRRFTVSLRPTLAVIAGAVRSPGADWSWRAVERLGDGSPISRTPTRPLQVENASYRAATGELAEQISTLQTAVDQLGERAAVDPNASRAMEKLPATVKSRAMGGMTGMSSASRAAFSPLLGGTDAALGVLSDLLGVLGSRLDSVRDGVERRHALASATPSVWPVAGWLTSTFGNRRDPITRGSDFHPGLDISADYGQPVLATGDATVSSAGPNGAYGNMVMLDHGFGIATKYGHLSRFAIAGRPAGQTRRGHWLRRVHGPLDRRAPALRDLDERPADQPDDPPRPLGGSLRSQPGKKAEGRVRGQTSSETRNSARQESPAALGPTRITRCPTSCYNCWISIRNDHR